MVSNFDVFGIKEKETNMVAQVYGLGTGVLPSNAPSPLIKVEKDEAEKRGGKGLEVATIEVEDERGMTARFWVSVRINNQGQAQIEVAANKTVRTGGLTSGLETVKKSVTGVYRV